MTTTPITTTTDEMTGLAIRCRDRPDDPAAWSDLAAALGPIMGACVRSGLRADPAADRRDLSQAAWVGLIEAVRRYDETRGARFSTYATHWMRGQIRSLRRGSWHALGFDPDADCDGIGISGGDGEDDTSPSSPDVAWLYGAVARLPRRQRATIRALYGLPRRACYAAATPALSRRQAAARLDVVPSTVQIAAADALRNLRKMAVTRRAPNPHPNRMEVA